MAIGNEESASFSRATQQEEALAIGKPSAPDGLKIVPVQDAGLAGACWDDLESAVGGAGKNDESPFGVGADVDAKTTGTDAHRRGAVAFADVDGIVRAGQDGLIGEQDLRAIGGKARVIRVIQPTDVVFFFCAVFEKHHGDARVIRGDEGAA